MIEKYISEDYKNDVENKVKNLQSAFEAIQQPRTDFTIHHFVVGQHLTATRQYHQCVLEMQVKYHSIKRAQLQLEKQKIELEKLESDESKLSQIDAKLKRIDIEEAELGLLGAYREFDTLYKIWQSYPQFTREQLEAGETEYWHKRLIAQAERDILQGGRINAGNMEALQQIGYVPQLKDNQVILLPPDSGSKLLEE